VLASYLRRVRAAAAEPEQIVVSSGYAQGLNLILRALARSGVRQVAIEDPGDLSNSAVSRRTGLDVIPVPVDEKGIVTEELAATRARAVVLTPAHQSPTGVVLAPSGATPWRRGQPSARRRSSKTTTTPSSATTASRSARSRAWTPSEWS
jgi:DNA-binding transcriptional MocR family regulator